MIKSFYAADSTLFRYNTRQEKSFMALLHKLNYAQYEIISKIYEYETTSDDILYNYLINCSKFINVKCYLLSNISSGFT